MACYLQTIARDGDTDALDGEIQSLLAQQSRGNGHEVLRDLLAAIATCSFNPEAPGPRFSPSTKAYAIPVCLLAPREYEAVFIIKQAAQRHASVCASIWGDMLQVGLSPAISGHHRFESY